MSWSCGKMGDEKLAKRADFKESRFPEGRGEMDAEKTTEIAMGIALKVTYKEWEKMDIMIERRNRRLLTENVVRKK